MYKRTLRTLTLLAIVSAGAASFSKGAAPKSNISELWVSPADLETRNLLYGSGGKQHRPRTTEFVFVKEDETGTNPKLIVQDAAGQKWKVKLGAEAQPETAASRFVWAAGYYTQDFYLLPRIAVSNLPDKLHRGHKLVSPNGDIENARLTPLDGAKKVGGWKWTETPFNATREFNGLRVLMALINNWDLKDKNVSIYEKRDGRRIYMVSDLGGTFGTTGISWSKSEWKGNLDAFQDSKFIRSLNPEFVSFAVPARPQINGALAPSNFVKRFEMEWIGRRIPREHARWLGQLLGRLSAAQIRDAFRAAAYSPEDTEGFASVIENRIAELKNL